MNKNLDYYLGLSYPFEVVEDAAEGGFVVSFPDLPGCLSCAETLDKAVANAQEAKRDWIACCIEDGLQVPEPNHLEGFSGQFKLRLPKSLHRSLADHARREGVSMNQYCVYLLSKQDALQSA